MINTELRWQITIETSKQHSLFEKENAVQGGYCLYLYMCIITRGVIDNKVRVIHAFYVMYVFIFSKGHDIILSPYFSSFFSL